MSQSRAGRSEGRIWAAALFLTLLLHAGTAMLMLVLEPFDPAPVVAKEPEPIQMVFAPTPQPSPRADSEEPNFFSELPEDRADVAPDRADLLSNVTSRARDQVQDGVDGAMPRMEGRGESPQVALDPGTPGAPGPGQDSQDRNPQPPQPAETEGIPEGEGEESSRAPDVGGREDSQRSFERGQGGEDEVERHAEGLPEMDPSDRRPANRDAREDMLQRRGGTGVPQVRLPGAGRSDIFQEEMNNPVGNTALFGEISLNTLEWAYAPWLQRFRRDFLRNWVAPYAYYMGIIDGWTMIELEVDLTGRLLGLEVLEEEGHKSLSLQGVAGFKATAPFRPLPEGFPEPTLVIRIKLIYPPLMRR